MLLLKVDDHGKAKGDDDGKAKDDDDSKAKKGEEKPKVKKVKKTVSWVSSFMDFNKYGHLGKFLPPI